MLDRQMKPDDRQPILMVVFGRKRVGTTILVNAIVQYWRAQGHAIRVWNADHLNHIHALRHIIPDVEVAPGADLQDAKDWVAAQMTHLIRHRYDAVLDIGNGVTEFTQLVNERGIREALEHSGIRMVGSCCLGPDMIDLDFLDQVGAIDDCALPASMIVLNNAMVARGRPEDGAFEWLLEHEAVQRAFERGAPMAFMPALSCMREVTDRRLTFPQAMTGDISTGARPLSLFDRSRVKLWWTGKMRKFFQRWPSEWMPTPMGAAVPDDLEASRWKM